jgi:hypothetical protein
MVETRNPRLANSLSSETSKVVLPLPLHPITPKIFVTPAPR